MSDVDPSEAEPDPDAPKPKNRNAGTRRGVKTQEQQRAEHQKAVDAFWTAVLSDPIGRAEMWRILSSGGAFKAPFACGPTGFPQPEATWFKAGQQALVLGEYHRLLRTSLELVRLMLLENDPAWKTPE